MPIFSKRIQEIAVKIPTTETELKFKDLIGRAVRDFHFTEEPFRREQQKNARRVKAEIISTMMCLVVQEKIDQERFQFSFEKKFKLLLLKNYFQNCFKIPTADLPSVYNWEEYAKEKIWQKFRWQYMNKHGEFKDLPGRKVSNGKWPCLDEFIDDHWLGQGKENIFKAMQRNHLF